ncbi:MAG: Hsp70 family protein [Planctomycetota bacterium]|nr:Hsp70 family protein [Planctomycetota bacterium]
MAAEFETIVGIDLGTTNSVVSIVENGRPRVIGGFGESILPSIVGVDAQGGLLVGHPARNQLGLAPERTVRSIKRRMGEDCRIPLGKQEFTPQEISAVILRKLCQQAEADLKRPVKKAVITVPAFFKEVQREATRVAGELAGLEVVRIINEPTAAALAYNAEPDRAERLLVYDLGGGTFDVSLVQVEGGVVEVLASHGDTKLGGDDFDRLLLNKVCDQFQEEHGIDLRESPISHSRMLTAVEEAKKRLSFEGVTRLEEEFIAEKDGVALHVDMELHRGEFELLIQPLLQKTLTCVDKAIQDADLTTADIERVLLVGGSTRTPLVSELLEEQLGLPLRTDVDPDLCVAMGAAVQGALISGQDVSAVLVDITPHSLGVEVLGLVRGQYSPHHFARLIRRNSPLPITASDVFTTAVDGQKVAVMDVFQGENEDTRLNEKVGDFSLEGLADVAEGNEIQVKFTLDVDGVLHAIATERATGNEKQITIDNAIRRFQGQAGDEARDRLDRAFAASPELQSNASDAWDKNGLDTEESAVVGTMSATVSAPENPELAQLIDRAEEAIRLGRPLKSVAADEDAEELDQLLNRLQSAVDTRSEAKVKESLNELEDLIFYLQDA